MSKLPVSIWRVTPVGFDAIGSGITRALLRRWKPQWYAKFLPETLDDLSGKMPNLRQQMMRLMSGGNQRRPDMILLLSKKNAEERPGGLYLQSVSSLRPAWFSPREFRLTMTRGDIGNYLGLTV